MSKKNINPILVAFLLVGAQSMSAYADQSTTSNNKSYKEKSNNFAFDICVGDITKDPKALRAVTGVTTVSSLCGCLKSEMNLLVNDQLAKDLGVAMNNTGKNNPLSEEDKLVIGDWRAKYSASLSGCSNKVMHEFK